MKFNTKKWSVILGVLLLLIFSINSILSVVVSNLVNTQLQEINEQKKLTISVGKINLNVFTGDLNLKNVQVKPDSLFFENFKKGLAEKASTSEFTLSELKIKGFGIYAILVHKEVYARKIIAKGLQLNLYKLDNPLDVESNSTEGKIARIDSIFIKEIKQIDFKRVVFEDFDFRIMNVKNADTLFSYSGEACEISGVNLDAHPTIENYFVVDKKDLEINFKEQEIKTNNGDYTIGLNDIKYNYKSSSLVISNFKLNPTLDKKKLAATYPYNTEVYEINTKNIQFKGFYLDSILRKGVVSLDTVLVEQPIFGIYIDQTKPQDLNKRPKFLNELLKGVTEPFNIEKILLKNGELNYREKHEKFKELMVLDISNLNAEFSNVTSLKDSLDFGSDLKINLKGNICKVAPLNLDVVMHYNTYNNSYLFTGSVGAANFINFNDALYAGTGVKFESGKLQQMNFTVTGTTAGSTGKLLMRYTNLNAKIFKDHKKKKTISWIGNSIIVDSNPTKKGKLRVGAIEFEREPHKGFGNLLWKSVLSGMVNTVNPVGKIVKEEKKKTQTVHKKEKKKWFSKF
ncbi:hypothetical protein ACFQ5N_02950 [Lutibacter holmesii]|uniref:AsmA-like C-terminal domain-containing protein n=1 Tax=Lutibacter holmesii TaxID=1137985 RepID=A0ABW3WM42_9FLAO